MTSVRHLKTVLLVLHVAAAVFAAVVLGLAAASIAETNKAASAVNNSLARLQVRKLLATARITSAPVVPNTYYYDGWGHSATLGFSLFVGLAGFFVSGWLALCYLKPVVYDKTLGVLAAKSPTWAKWPFYELVIACMWSIFWLAAAGAATDSPFGRISAWCTDASACGKINAILAFSWLSWFIWLTIVVLTAVEYGITAHHARKVQGQATGTTTQQAAPGTAKADDKAAAADKPVDIQMVQTTHE